MLGVPLEEDNDCNQYLARGLVSSNGPRLLRFHDTPYHEKPTIGGVSLAR